MRDFSQLDFLRLNLRKQEQAAKTVPYVSFILTHAALVLFLVSAFFVNRLVDNPSEQIPVKIFLVVIGVALIAAEWMYAIVTSRRWKHDVVVLLKLEAAQRQKEAEEKMRRQEEMIATEQLRNRVLQADNQRLRSQNQYREPEAFPPVRSVRPINSALPPLPEMPRDPASFTPPRSIRPVNPAMSLPPDMQRGPSYPTREAPRPYPGEPPYNAENTRWPLDQ